MARYTEDTFPDKQVETPKVTPEGKKRKVGQSLRQDIFDLGEELTEAIGALREAGKNWATKDNEMRKARAKAFLQATGKNKEEREAKADAHFEKERLACNEAEGEKVVCKEYVQSLRTIISALQSLVYADRSEHESIKYNQTQQDS